MDHFGKEWEAWQKAVRMLPEEAADRMGCSANYVRKSLRAGTLPFGNATKYPGSTRWTYYISRQLFDAWEEGRLVAGKTYQP